jgi:hypothetical protein
MSDDAEEDAMEEIPMTPSPAPVEAKAPVEASPPGVVVRDEEQSADATSTPAAPHEPASPPPAFTEEDLRIMEVERKRTQELYVREAELKRREKAVAVAELASPESLAQMNAERRRVAEDFRLQALAKKMQEANVRASSSTSPSSSPAAASIAAIECREMEWMERERLERRRVYELEAAERSRAAERAVTAEDILRRKEAEASARRAMAEAMYAPAFVPPPSAVLGPTYGVNAGESGSNGFTIDSTADVHTVTLEEVLSPKAGSDASKTVDGIEERLDEKRREEEEEEQEQEEEEGSAKADMSGKADATEEENETEDANAIDRIADQLAADADEDAAWAELDEMDGTITYGQIPWPPAGVMGPVTLPANIDRARVKRMVTRYHPDKFAQKYGERIAAEDKTRVEEKVKQVCQVVNERYAALRDA